MQVKVDESQGHVGHEGFVALARTSPSPDADYHRYVRVIMTRVVMKPAKHSSISDT